MDNLRLGNIWSQNPLSVENSIFKGFWSRICPLKNISDLADFVSLGCPVLVQMYIPEPMQNTM